MIRKHFSALGNPWRVSEVRRTNERSSKRLRKKLLALAERNLVSNSAAVDHNVGERPGTDWHREQ
jgi:hypothetical protein